MHAHFDIADMIAKSYSSRLIAKKVAGQLYDLTGDYYSVANTGNQQFVVLPKEPAMPILVQKPTTPITMPDVPMQVVTFPAVGIVAVSLPFLKETDTDIAGTDCNGTRRWFNKIRDEAVRDGDSVRAKLTRSRAKAKGLLETV